MLLLSALALRSADGVFGDETMIRSICGDVLNMTRTRLLSATR